jgi:hypothetical protein
MAFVIVALAVSGRAIWADGADDRPFRLAGTATWDDIFAALPPAFGGLGTASFEGVAQVTHLGRVEQSGVLALGAPIAPGIFPGAGSVVLVAANGDELRFDYSGLLDASTGIGAGSLTFTGGTGRFADASGSGTFVAHIDLSAPAEQHMDVVIDGEIDY